MCIYEKYPKMELNGTKFGELLTRVIKSTHKSMVYVIIFDDSKWKTYGTKTIRVTTTVT